MRRGKIVKIWPIRTDTPVVSTQASSAQFPGGRRWHASLPLLAATLTCVLLVATVGFAGFAARQLAQATDTQASMGHMRDQLTSATSHLERANRLLAMSAKVVQAAAEVQRIDQLISEQRTLAFGIQKTTKESIAALGADKGVKGAARAKSIAKLNSEMKAQLAAFAEKEQALSEERQPLAEALSAELGHMLATYADEAARQAAQAKKAPVEAPVDAPAKTAESPPTEAPAAAVENSEVRDTAANAGEPAEAPAKTAVRPGRDGSSGTGIGSGKQVEP